MGVSSMICPKCKNKLTKIVTFCPYCKWDQRIEYVENHEHTEDVVENKGLLLSLDEAIKTAVADVLNLYKNEFDSKKTVHFTVKTKNNFNLNENIKASEIELSFSEEVSIKEEITDTIENDLTQINADESKIDEVLVPSEVVSDQSTQVEPELKLPEVKHVEEQVVLEHKEEIKVIDHEQPSTNNSRIDYTKASYFTGGLLGLIGTTILSNILILITLGLGLPWAIVMRYRWKVEHTYIHGKRLYFDGTGGQLFGSYIKWVFFTFITFGIYAIFIPVRIEQWKAKHTHFHDYDESSISEFTGSTLGLIGINILTVFLLTMTIGIALPWVISIRMDWFSKHQKIDGMRIKFDGHGSQLIGNYIIWLLLSGITFGIYGLWIPIKFKQWVTKHQYIQSNIAVSYQVNSVQSTQSLSQQSSPKLKEIPTLKVVDDSYLNQYFKSNKTLFSTDIVYMFKTVFTIVFSVIILYALTEMRLKQSVFDLVSQSNMFDMIISFILGNIPINNVAFIGTNFPITMILFTSIPMIWLLSLIVNILGAFLKWNLKIFNLSVASLYLIIAYIIMGYKDAVIIMNFRTMELMIIHYDIMMLIVPSYVLLIINLLFTVTNESVLVKTFTNIQKIELKSRMRMVKKINQSLIKSVIFFASNILILILYIAFFELYVMRDLQMSQGLRLFYAAVLVLLIFLIPIQSVVIYSFLEMKLRFDPNHMPALFMIIRIFLVITSFGMIVLFSMPFVQLLKSSTFKKVQFKQS